MTVADVARAAGVSAGTVSNVLTGRRSVSPERAAAVHAAMAELNYIPNHLAKSLRMGRSQTIGLVVPDLANPYFGELAKGAQDACEAQEVLVLIASAGSDHSAERRHLERLRGRGIDGLLYSGTGALGDSLLEVARGVTTVFIDFDRDGGDVTVDSVVTDDIQGGAKVGTHLRELGHRNVLLVQGPDGSWTSGRRIAGFRHAYEDMPGKRLDVVSGEYRMEAARETVARIIERDGPWFSAVFAANDLMAVGAMQAIRAAGLQVPTDISVAGYDDVPIAAMVNPGLTTVTQPFYRLGWLGAERLLGRIQGEDDGPRVHMVLDVDLVVRASTVPAAFA